MQRERGHVAVLGTVIDLVGEAALTGWTFFHLKARLKCDPLVFVSVSGFRGCPEISGQTISIAMHRWATIVMKHSGRQASLVLAGSTTVLADFSGLLKLKQVSD
jgi:hypothetical protein